MTEVHVLFHGLVLWLMATSPGYPVVVPDFSDAPTPHVASIAIDPSDVVGGTCPPLFTLADGLCRLGLTNISNAGGVGIEVDSGLPSPSIAQASMCEVPKLRGTLLVLKPEYTPPSGSGLAAHLTVTEGTVLGSTTSCTNAPDCPRFTRWKLTSGTSPTLRLSNLNVQGLSSMTISIKPTAVVYIQNHPSSQALPALRARTEMRAEQKLTDLDWCLYYAMFVGNPPCQPPTVPECSTATATAAKRKKVAGAVMIDTIACSNSQYP